MTQLPPVKSERVQVATSRYLDLNAPPARLRDSLAVEVSPRAFLPRLDDLQADWVASVATPAFKLIRQQQGKLTSFASIGTGTGLDALAAIETLGVSRVGITDVHDDVVSIAARNISHNLLAPGSVEIESGFGDLLSPLAHYKPRYDLIYENLPNVPINDAAQIANERISSGHVPPRPEAVPESVQRQLLTLHYLALKQARDFLAPGGSVLSMLGGRVPLAAFLDMAKLARLRAEIFTYTWKVQAEPESMIRGHADRQREGFGPFYFYRTADLAQTFAGIDLVSTGKGALELEKSLVPHRLDAHQALAAFRNGEQIGHTAVVLRSQLA
jgi:methylase of polypeptide subunit release factors